MYIDLNELLDDYYGTELIEVYINLITTDGIELSITLKADDETIGFYKNLKMMYSLFKHDTLINHLKADFNFIKVEYLPSFETLH